MANSTLCGLKKYKIRELEPFIPNCMLVCIIISKQQPRKFSSNNEDRAVWNFTVRDSPVDYINVTCWGQPDLIFSLNEKFQIGDIIEIQKPRIDIRKGGRNDEFHPNVTSPFVLSLNDGESEIVALRDGNFQELLRVLHLPTKPIQNYVNLADIHEKMHLYQNDYPDIMVAVRAISEVRNVNTKFGQSQVRNVTVFDYSSPAMTISFWNPEYIARASLWKPRSTILFMTDMKILNDPFNKGAKASMSGRTIITENPLCNESEKLREYAKTAALHANAILDQMAGSLPDSSSIQNIMNICQIQMKIKKLLAETIRSEDAKFTAKVYATITDFNIDGSKVVSTRCVRCRVVIVDTKCKNPQCTIGANLESIEPETSFDLRITLTDHTGNLINCKLSGKNAEKVLNSKCEEFIKLTDEQKNDIKWDYLMNRCDIRLMVLCITGKDPMITIISCTLVNPNEIIKVI